MVLLLGDINEPKNAIKVKEILKKVIPSCLKVFITAIFQKDKHLAKISERKNFKF